ncbi:MAG: PAS domain-containing protein [Patescibacteria group bacterium]
MGIFRKKESSRGANDELAQLKGDIKAFWEFLPTPVCYTNFTFNILNASKSFEVFSGFKNKEIIGQNLKTLFFNSQEAKCAQKDLLERGLVNNCEIMFTAKSKEKIPVNMMIAARTDENNNIVGFFFVFLDITERKTFEKEFKEKIDDFEKFQRLAVGRELRMIELKAALRLCQQEKLNPR